MYCWYGRGKDPPADQHPGQEHDGEDRNPPRSPAPWSGGLAKEHVDQLRQFTGIHLDHRRPWPTASGVCSRESCTKSFQRQDLHLVSTTIVALHLGNIGRG